MGLAKMLLLGTGKHRGAAGGWGEKITDAVKLCRAPTREQSAIGCSSVIRCRRTYRKKCTSNEQRPIRGVLALRYRPSLLLQ